MRRDNDNVANRPALAIVFAVFLAPIAAQSQVFSPCGASALPWTPKENAISTGLLAGSGALSSRIEPASAVLDSLYRSVPNEGAAGIAVLAVQNGKVLFKRAYGFADLQKHLALTTASRLAIYLPDN